MSEAVLAAGTRVGGYIIEQPIGAGGMATVYAASHEFLGARVALKVLHRQFRGRSDIVAKMRGEAQLLRKLEHPSLVRVTDAGMTEDGTVWMAMDLLSGETLRARLDRCGRLPLPSVLRYATQAVAGLAAAHRQGVVHRDIKPENLFITESDDVRLLDFGTAKFRDHKRTAAGTIPFVTMAYTSPEQLSAGVAEGHHSDMYSLGIVMHEALTGAHYLRRPDGTFPPLDELMMLQLSREPRLDGLPNAVAAVIHRATQKRSTERYATMQELGAALSELQETFSATESATTPSPRRGLRIGTTAGLALVVAMLSAGATFLVESRTRAAVTRKPVKKGGRPSAAPTNRADFATTIVSAPDRFELPPPPRVDWTLRAVPVYDEASLKQRLVTNGYDVRKSDVQQGQGYSFTTITVSRPPCSGIVSYQKYDDAKYAQQAKKAIEERGTSRIIVTEGRLLQAGLVRAEFPEGDPSCTDPLVVALTD